MIQSLDTIKLLLITLIGEYSPQYDESGNLLTGVCGLDYVWLVSACIFVLSVWFVYRLILSFFREVC